MLESLKQFIADLAGGTKPQHHFQDGDYRLAAAALLIHVSTIDGEASPVRLDADDARPPVGEVVRLRQKRPDVGSRRKNLSRGTSSHSRD